MTDLTKFGVFLLGFQTGALADIPMISPEAVALSDRLRAGIEVSVSEMESAVASDPFLTAKTIGVANSIFHNVSGTDCLTVQDALVRLSPDYLGQLMMNAVRFSAVTGQSGAALWGHQMEVVNCLRKIHEVLVKPSLSLAVCEAAAMVHDIGFLIEAQYDESRLPNIAANYSSSDNETHAHCTLGESLALHWFLPPLFVDVVANHHDPEKAASDDARWLSSLVAVADEMAHCASEGIQIPRFRNDVLKRLGLSESCNGLV